jgi:nicotinic acid mononucleotide adenylyltransferase
LLPAASHLAFLIGADAFAEIRTWYRWQDVVRLVEFIVVTRPGSDYDRSHRAQSSMSWVVWICLFLPPMCAMGSPAANLIYQCLQEC